MAKRHHRRHHRRNPYELAMQGRDYLNPEGGMLRYPYQNPDLMSPLTKGTAVTQGVSLVDVFAGGLSFLVNGWLIRQLDLKELSGLVGSAIVPVITGAIAGAASNALGIESVGPAVFLGGEMETALKAVGMLTKGSVGLSDSGDEFVLKVPGRFEGLSHLKVGADQLKYIDHAVTPFTPRPAFRKQVLL